MTSLVLYDFYSPSCHPCKTILPHLEKIATDFPQVKLRKVDVNKEPGLATQFAVTSLPSLALMNGKVLWSASGYTPHMITSLRNKIYEALSS